MPANFPGNPFQSPAADPNDAPIVTSGVERQLRATRPWVLLLSVFGVICMGFMLLAAVAMLSGLTAPNAAGLPSWFALGMGVFYVVIIAAFTFPLVFMFKYAGRIRRFADTGSAALLEDALAAQRGFWKSSGVAMLVTTALYIVAVILVVIAGVSGAMTGVANQFDEINVESVDAVAE